MEILSFLTILVVSIFVSAFGTLIGGSSIVTIPLLMLLGLPPHTAIGTDRFGVIGVGIAGWYKFQKKGLINYRLGLVAAIPILFGSAVGANIVLQISEVVLKNVIIVTNIILVIFLMFNPGIGVEKRKAPLNTKDYIGGVIISFIVGVYGGFYGAMAGTLAVYIFLMWFRQTFIESAASMKLGSVSMTVTAATVFGLNNAVDYYLGSGMFIGCLIGSYIGAHYSERIGNVWVKRIFIAFVIIALIKLIISR